MNAALHSPDARAAPTVSQAPGATHGISSSGHVQTFAVEKGCLLYTEGTQG